jgi:hypothetical protein
VYRPLAVASAPFGGGCVSEAGTRAFNEFNVVKRIVDLDIQRADQLAAAYLNSNGARRRRRPVQDGTDKRHRDL